MNLKELVAPQARHLFLQNSEESYAFQIVHVENEYVYFCSKKSLHDSFTNGHCLAHHNKGIILFHDPEIQRLENKNKAPEGIHLYRINFAKTNYEITDRRRHSRHKFDQFLPMSFNLFGDSSMGQLIDISESGARLITDTAMKKNTVCHLKLVIPTPNDVITFNPDAIVVFSDKNSNTKKFQIGLSFITPDFESDEEKQTYLESRQHLKTYLETLAG